MNPCSGEPDLFTSGAIPESSGEFVQSNGEVYSSGDGSSSAPDIQQFLSDDVLLAPEFFIRPELVQEIVFMDCGPCRESL